MKRRAFTLVEVILVVTILGILAALVVPTFQDHVTTAKVSAVKTNLSTIRSQIELYRLQHHGVPPGYVDKDPVQTIEMVVKQFTSTSTDTGSTSLSTVPSIIFPYGPYLKKFPANPFNKLSTLAFVAETTEFSAAVNGTSSGWLYKRETGEIAINWTGNDPDGVAYSSY